MRPACRQQGSLCCADDVRPSCGAHGCCLVLLRLQAVSAQQGATATLQGTHKCLHSARTACLRASALAWHRAVTVPLSWACIVCLVSACLFAKPRPAPQAGPAGVGWDGWQGTRQDHVTLHQHCCPVQASAAVHADAAVLDAGIALHAADDSCGWVTGHLVQQACAACSHHTLQVCDAPAIGLHR